MAHRFLSLLLLVAWGTLVAREARPVPVETAEAQRRPVSRVVERPGTLKYRRLLQVYNQEEGRLEQFSWYEGDRVKQGQLLLEIDSRLLRARIRKARADLELKQRRRKRLEQLLKQNSASSDEVAEARTEVEMARAELELLETRLGHTRVTAPFDGLVIERFAEPGDVKPKYSHLLTLADPRSLVARFRAEAGLLDELVVGDPLTIRVGDREWPGHLSRLFPVVDPSSRLGKAEASFDALPNQARENQYVRITLRTRPRERLLIPFSALRRDRKGEYVYLVREGQAWRQAVTSGHRFDGEIEILEGLEAGQPVVRRGFLGLRTGASVTVPRQERQTGEPSR